MSTNTVTPTIYIRYNSGGHQFVFFGVGGGDIQTEERLLCQWGYSIVGHG